VGKALRYAVLIPCLNEETTIGMLPEVFEPAAPKAVVCTLVGRNDTHPATKLDPTPQRRTRNAELWWVIQ